MVLQAARELVEGQQGMKLAELWMRLARQVLKKAYIDTDTFRESLKQRLPVSNLL
jgi:hypothetical protein